MEDGYPMDVLRAVEAPQSTLFDCIALLPVTRDNVALQFRLCQRIQQFGIDQIAFWLPQLVHVYVTVETEAAALEDLLLSICQQSTHCALAVFWFVQSALSDLKPDPHSFGFAAAKRLSNKLQRMLFAGGELPVNNVMHENTEPAMVLAGILGAAVGMPRLGKHMKQLVESQGRKQRSSYLIRQVVSKFRPNWPRKEVEESTHKEIGIEIAGRWGSDGDIGLTLNNIGSQPNLHHEILGASSQAYRSMPDLHHVTPSGSRETPTSTLKTHYFRCETQFVYALNSISNRLLDVPKEARQSALQIELAMLNEDLPQAQVDLPMLLPQRNGKQNRIVRICTTEATVLNSAEKAPFLLLIEYLRGELTFDPQNLRNREILRYGPKLKTHIFERPALHQTPRVTPEPVDPRNTTTGDDEAAATGHLSHTTAESVDLTEVQQLDFESLEVDISEVSLLDREDLMRDGRRQSSVTPEGGTLPVSAVEIDGATQVQESRQFAEGPSAADLATQLRAASVILAQLDASKLPRNEVQMIKSRVLESMQRMKCSPKDSQGVAGVRRLENDLKLSGLSVGEEHFNLQDEDDPSAANLGEDWLARKARIRRSSKFGNLPNWDLVSVIVKTGDDLRQEALASQLMQRVAQLWKTNGIDVWVRRMMILITSANSGLVETITNALSLHSIKKALTTAEVNSHTRDSRTIAQLKLHFKLKFGPENGSKYLRAVKNFVQSLAGYSVLCYVLQIKDRHNGNILVDADGHIIHIDFGFMLSNSPGHIGFEANTFKLTPEYVDLMGGTNSENWELFMKLTTSAFLVLREHSDELVSFLQIMGTNSTLPCFRGGALATAQQMRQRLMPYIAESDAADAFAALVRKSENNRYTWLYDQYQLITQGIYY